MKNSIFKHWIQAFQLILSLDARTFMWFLHHTYVLKGSPKDVACSLLITQDGLQYTSCLTEITEQSMITAKGNTTIKILRDTFPNITKQNIFQ